MKRQRRVKAKQPQSTQQRTCPTCHRPFLVPPGAKIGRYGSLPFCSERCKLIDLGAWLDAEYRIPARPDEESEDALYGDFGDSEATA
ncbi:MAG: DNA gyrase inhibitor YacG [Phycisphaerales bacterium]|nr:MAG: DNA gyrase inhibitor YacG [Phycisphaerales bacterium]